jgi:uncharacterized membrane protein
MNYSPPLYSGWGLGGFAAGFALGSAVVATATIAVVVVVRCNWLCWFVGAIRQHNRCDELVFCPVAAVDIYIGFPHLFYCGGDGDPFSVAVESVEAETQTL